MGPDAFGGELRLRNRLRSIRSLTSTKADQRRDYIHANLARNYTQFSLHTL